MKILIVEDDPSQQLLLKEILKNTADIIHTANDGLQAMQSFSSTPRCLKEDTPCPRETYDYVFLDIMMPNQDGLITLKQMREYEHKNKTLKPAQIIMLTAIDDFKIIHDAFSTGANNYLIKPVAADKIHDLNLA